MFTPFTAAAATANAGTYSADGHSPTFVILDVTVASAPVFTLKCNARAKGAGLAGAALFTGFVGVRDMNNPSTVIPGATGITAAGNYILDVTGLEFQLEYVRSSGGNMTVRANYASVD